MTRLRQQDGFAGQVAPARRFTVQSAEQACDRWGANCGPVALAAMLDLRMDEVRDHLGDFERKGYTNPTMMLAALASLRARYSSKREPNPGVGCWDWPVYGLCRIQWEGPWTAPGVPIAARYRHTHWIGVSHPLHSTDVGIFDVNCLNNGTGWVSLSDWRNIVVPHLLRICEPRASGAWHVTHVVEIEPRAACAAQSAVAAPGEMP